MSTRMELRRDQKDSAWRFKREQWGSQIQLTGA
jgi:hypothetical protein